MEIKYFELLAYFNKEANGLMNSIIKNITEEEWNKNLSGFYKSIHEICSHIYISDYNWLKRYNQLRHFVCLDGKYFEKSYSFTEIIFSSISEYIDTRHELDNKIIEFIDEVTENDLENILKYSNSKGMEFEKRMDGLLIHLFNHETHHRAMISIYLEILGKANDYNNVLPFVYKENKEFIELLKNK
jgi:uncharacterized damage-inducible protein DinB